MSHDHDPRAERPILLQDHYLIQKMQAFNRERVPERVVHAKGGGAFGYFQVTADVTPWTKAAFLGQVGKRTPVLARFSTVAGEQGYADTDRDPRGFALKFYTEEGNYDLVGNNTPVFFVRDPSKFQDFIRSQKRMPDTGLRSSNMQWDFWSLSPESLHQVAILMSDRHPELHRSQSEADEGRGPGLPPPRSLPGDRYEGPSGVAAGDADHAVRGRADDSSRGRDAPRLASR